MDKKGSTAVIAVVVVAILVVAGVTGYLLLKHDDDGNRATFAYFGEGTEITYTGVNEDSVVTHTYTWVAYSNSYPVVEHTIIMTDNDGKEIFVSVEYVLFSYTDTSNMTFLREDTINTIDGDQKVDVYSSGTYSFYFGKADSGMKNLALYKYGADDDSPAELTSYVLKPVGDYKTTHVGDVLGSYTVEKSGSTADLCVMGETKDLLIVWLHRDTDRYSSYFTTFAISNDGKYTMLTDYKEGDSSVVVNGTNYAVSGYWLTSGSMYLDDKMTYAGYGVYIGALSEGAAPTVLLIEILDYVGEYESKTVTSSWENNEA